MGKVVSLAEAELFCRGAHLRQQQIVLTNGAFDILHVGHLRYLKAARELGNLLIVAVNSDISVAAYKDPRRPIIRDLERAELIANLVCVDYVVLFDELTAENVVSLLQPDIYVKGGDYTLAEKGSGKELPEAKVVASYGGQVQIIPFVSGYSTSSIIEVVLSRYCQI